MREIKEIVFVRHTLRAFEIKLAGVLKKRGYKISAITFYNLDKDWKDIFDRNYYLLEKNKRKMNKYFKMLYILRLLLSVRKIKKNIVIGISGPNWFITLVFMILGKKAINKIYFPYDITYFRWKDYKITPWVERFSEKYNFRKSNGIIHKGPEDELNYLPTNFKALSKPSIQFLPYCDDSLMIKMDENYFKEKLSKHDGNIHLVYVGGVYHNRPDHFQTIDIFREIVKQKIYLDVYITSYDYIVDDPGYKKLQKNKYFKMHKPIYSKDLQKELAKYDWGVVIFLIDFKKLKKEWAATAFGNKTSTYLEAGLPNIVNNELSFSANVVKKNGFGITIDNLNELKKEIEKTDYEKLLKSLMKNRSEFTVNKNITRLEGFIQKI